jgi:hypothetical protein
MRVRRRSEIRSAWQYTDVLATPPGWVRSYTDTDEIGDLYLVRLSGKQRINLGDWLVRNLDGDPDWYDDESFHRNWEFVSHEPVP